MWRAACIVRAEDFGAFPYDLYAVAVVDILRAVSSLQRLTRSEAVFFLGGRCGDEEGAFEQRIRMRDQSGRSGLKFVVELEASTAGHSGEVRKEMPQAQYPPS